MKLEMKINLENNINHKTLFQKNSNINHNLKSNNAALFLDRDGVLIKDCHYIKKSIDVKILKGVRTLLKNAKGFGLKIVVITNQSGISKGIFNWKDYEQINKKMINLLGDEVFIDAIYANGCASDSSIPNWRKPNPMMLYEAQKDLKIQVNESIIVGDRLSDLMAGYNAGVKLLVHVLTGHGKVERDKIIKFFELPINLKKGKSPYRLGLKNSYQKILLINNLTELKDIHFN